MQKQYAIAGTWNFKGVALGISVFSYEPERGDMELLHHYDSHVAAGCQAYDKKRNILYVADECEHRSGERGGGGYVRAYRLNPEDGSLTMFSERKTILTVPAYLWLDISGEYCVVACHTKRNYVTKAVFDSAGRWQPCVIYDDVGVVLIRLNADGSFGEVCDIALHEGLTANAKQVHAHPHSIIGSPDGQIYFACDKGLDRIYSYKLDRENGKLIGMVQTPMDYASAPRYGVFHPELPVFYENNETSSKLYAFRYDNRTGRLETLSEISLFDENEEKGMQSDLLLHQGGKYLYAAIRNPDEIAILDVDPANGSLTLRQRISNNGAPRGLAISPDGRFLFSANAEAATINSYEIAEDGSLHDTGKQFTAPSAANISFVTV